MGSTNKTENLKLNQWLSTDRPVRMDYVEDNRIIDETVGEHINNNDIHLDEILKDKLSESFVIKTYGGTGTSQINIEFDFDVNFAIAFAFNKPFVSFDNSKLYANSGVANTTAGSKGISINGNEVILSQDTDSAGTEISNLNKSGNMYMVMAFK